MNEITVVGNVTADPVLRKSANGRGVVRFDVAINRRRFNREPTPRSRDQAVSDSQRP